MRGLVVLSLLWGASVALAQGTSPSASAKPKILVTDLVAQGVSPEEAAALTDAVVQTLEERGLFEVLSRKDVEAVLSAERQRQLLGACDEDNEGCVAEIGSALGTRFSMNGSISKLGAGVYQLALQVVDTVKARRVGRSSRLAKDLLTLRLQLPYAVAEAAGTPLPPPPSRLWQISAIGTGSAFVIGGGMLGMLALGRGAQLTDELCPGGPYDYGGNDAGAPDSCGGSSLQTRAYYEEQNRLLGTQKTWSLALMLTGAALAGAGLYFMPPPEGGPRVALVPSSHGIALVGVLP